MDRIGIIKGDITRMQVDAIVNAANSSLLAGGGVCGAIHRASGPLLDQECRTLGGCPSGEARITKGYNLPASYVIHTVGPVYRDGRSGEEGKLASCYRSSLQLAVENGIRTIAFPSISTGIFGYPVEEASRIALGEIRRFLATDDTISKIYLVCFSDGDLRTYQLAAGGRG